MELAHHPSHSQCALSRLSAAVVCFAQATHAGLSFILEEKDFMDDRHTPLELDLHEGQAHRFADMCGVSGFTPQNYAQADAPATISKACERGSHDPPLSKV